MTQTKRKTVPEQPLEATPLEEWKERIELVEQVKPLTLPDGYVVRVRRIELVDMAAIGVVPFALVSAFMTTGAKLQDPKLFSEIDQEEMSNFYKVLRMVALRAVVEPPLSETGGEDTIAVDFLGYENLVTIFKAVTGESNSSIFRPFRRK